MRFREIEFAAKPSRPVWRNLPFWILNYFSMPPFFWGYTQVAEMELYLCGGLQQGTSNQFYAREGNCEKMDRRSCRVFPSQIPSGKCPGLPRSPYELSSRGGSPITVKMQIAEMRLNAAIMSIGGGT